MPPQLSNCPTPELSHSPTAGDRSRESSTSVSTPLDIPLPSFAPTRKAREQLGPRRQVLGKRAHDSSVSNKDWKLLAYDLPDPIFGDDEVFFEGALFPEGPVKSPSANTLTFPKHSMAASPVDISLPPRLSASQSPRNQMSTLTSALQEAGATAQHVPDTSNSHGQFMPMQDPGRLSVSGRHDSVGNLFSSSYLGSGSRPIATRERSRRESNTGGSFMGNGMSWGGISVGSLRDDIMMTGTSPMPFGRSPSLHSSSYLPKMEAQFLSGYNCCGQKLDSLHDLLQHFEENHAQQSGQIAQHRSSVSSQAGFTGRRPSYGAQNGNSSGSISAADQKNMSGRQNSFVASRDGFNRTQLSTVQDMDSLEDMEMDESAVPATPVPATSSPVNQQTPTVAPLNTAVPPTISAGQPFRTSTPSTPIVSQAFQLYSNPTVSSVNTPALGAQGFQSTQSPYSSVPGTPAEPNLDFSNDYMGGMGMGMGMGMGGMGGIGMGGMGGMMMQNNQMMPEDFDFGAGFGLANTMNDMTIDDPAKRLASKTGGLTPQQIAYAVKNGSISIDGDMQKKLREQQLVGGLGGPVIGLNTFQEEVNKPFRCPVIGCEKAYKNQNGLKYHKQHGHNNQKLQENTDGSFSIVDPVTSIPYPGTIGMEKEKPYQCPVCGKRYKNLNGLKYHKQHSAPCNPDLQRTGNPLSGLNPNANVAGNMF